MSHAITTARLDLRPFQADDWPWVAEALADNDVARWVPLLPHPYGADDARAFMELQSSPEADALAVTFEGRGIGCITTAQELGYWFAKHAWGKGFATEAAQAVVAQYFETAQTHLQSGYILDNTRSYRVLSKLGFVQTETVERHSALLNQTVTVQRMELSRDSWEAML